MTDQTPSSSDIAKAAGIDVGSMLVQAIVASFFSPVPVGYTQQQVYSPNGPMMVPTPEYGPSPMSNLARVLFEQHRADIVAGVIERVDLSELTDKISDKVYETLTETQDRHGYKQLMPQVEQIQKMVREKMADRLTADAVEAFYREQAEMRHAYQEKKAREADEARQAALEAPKEEDRGE